MTILGVLVGVILALCISWIIFGRAITALLGLIGIIVLLVSGIHPYQMLLLRVVDPKQAATVSTLDNMDSAGKEIGKQLTVQWDNSVCTGGSGGSALDSRAGVIYGGFTGISDISYLGGYIVNNTGLTLKSVEMDFHMEEPNGLKVQRSNSLLMGDGTFSAGEFIPFCYRLPRDIFPVSASIYIDTLKGWDAAHLPELK